MVEVYVAHLTISLVDTLWKQGRPGRHGDAGCPGLYLKVTAPRAASWVLRFQLNGRRSEMGLGSHPALALAEARESAREQRKLAPVDQIDPLAHRQAERSKARAQNAKQQYTVGELIEDFAKVKNRGWSPWTAYAHRLNMKNHVLPVIGEVLVRDVTRRTRAQSSRSNLERQAYSRPRDPSRSGATLRVCGILRFANRQSGPRHPEIPTKASRTRASQGPTLRSDADVCRRLAKFPGRLLVASRRRRPRTFVGRSC